MKTLALTAFIAVTALWAGPLHAQAVRVTSCGSGAPPPGVSAPTMDTTGLLCTSGTGASTPTTPGTLTLVPLDVATVTTGGTAVTALTAGHRNKGGWLQNPPSATINLCINEIGTASGTTSAGSTTCIQPGQSYALTPNTGAVSVISSDSAHPFSGVGFN